MIEVVDAEQRIQTACLLIISSVALGFALYWLKPVMIPFVLAVFISLGLSAAIDVQVEHFKVARPLALLSTLAMSILIFTLVGLLISASVGQLVENASSYEAQIRKLLQLVSEKLPFEIPAAGEEGSFRPLSEISVGTISTMLLQTTNAIVATLSRSLLVFIFILYLLIGGGVRSRPGGVWGDIESRVKRYLVTKALLSAATGLLVTFLLFVLGVDLALMFGMFAFLLNFIPSVGSVIATLLPLPVVLVSPDVSITQVILVILLPGGVQMAIGNFLEPKIMGDSLGLHPVVVLLALIFWGMLWGVVGMLLATPITAVMKIMFEKLEPTRPIAALMAGASEQGA